MNNNEFNDCSLSPFTRFVRFTRYRSSNRTHFNDQEEEDSRSKISRDTITCVRRADRNLYFTSNLQYYFSRENEKSRILLLLFIFLWSYRESFDATNQRIMQNMKFTILTKFKAKINPIYHCANIGLHLREEKEILAQRGTERMIESQSQKVSSSLFFTIKKKSQRLFLQYFTRHVYKTNTSVPVGL